MLNPSSPACLWLPRVLRVACWATAHLAMAAIGGCATPSETTSSGSDASANSAARPAPMDISPGPQDGAAPLVEGSFWKDGGKLPAVCSMGPGGSWRRATLLVLPKATEGCDLDADGKPNNAFSAGLSSVLATFNARLQAEVNDPGKQWLVRLQPDWSVELYRGRLTTAPQVCPAAGCGAEVLANLSPEPNSDPCAPLAVLWLQVEAPAGVGLASVSTATLATPWKELPSVSVIFLALEAGPTTVKLEAGLDSGLICGAMALPYSGSGLKADLDLNGDGIKNDMSFAVKFATAPVALVVP